MVSITGVAGEDTLCSWVALVRYLLVYTFVTSRVSSVDRLKISMTPRAPVRLAPNDGRSSVSSTLSVGYRFKLAFLRSSGGVLPFRLFLPLAGGVGSYSTTGFHELNVQLTA